MTKTKDFIKGVNEQIEPSTLFRLLEWSPEGLRAFGPLLKCHCPIHKGLFASLVIDSRRKTFRCTVRDCAASRGGTLVDLWALTKKIDPVDAALDLCGRLGFRDEKDIALIRRGLLVESAEEALSQDDTDRALALAERACDIDSGDHDAQLLRTRALLARGDKAGAIANLCNLARDYQERKDFEQARDIYQRAIALEESNRRARHGLATIYRAQGKTARALNAYRELCDINTREAHVEENVVWYEKMLELDDSLNDTRRLLADTQISQGQIDQGVMHLRRLAEEHAKADDIDASVSALRRIVEVRPDEGYAVREEIGVLSERFGLVSEAIGEYQALADALFAAGRPDDGARLSKRVARLAYDQFDERFRIACRYESFEMREEATAEYLDIARSAGRSRDFEAQLRASEAGCRLDPSQTDFHARRADALMMLGREKDGVATDSEDVESVIEAYTEILRVNSANFAVRCRLADLFDKKGLTVEAREHRIRASDELMARGEIAQGIRILRRMAEKSPDDGEIRNRLARADIKRNALSAVESALNLGDAD